MGSRYVSGLAAEAALPTLIFCSRLSTLPKLGRPVIVPGTFNRRKVDHVHGVRFMGQSHKHADGFIMNNKIFLNQIKIKTKTYYLPYKEAERYLLTTRAMLIKWTFYL